MRREQVDDRDGPASASRKRDSALGAIITGGSATHRSSRARMERFLIGSGMAALAWLIEKVVLRSMKKKGGVDD